MMECPSVVTTRQSIPALQRYPSASERIAAILPIRALDDGKRRLSGRLSAAERRDLIVRLCMVVVQALRESSVIDTIGIVSGDDETLCWAEEQGLVPIREQGEGLNDALATGGAWARTTGADAQLIVLPDLPLLRAEDVRAIVRAGKTERSLVICSDRAGAGTNVLLMRPCEVILPRFGLDSFEHHLEAARVAGVPVEVCNLPDTSWDIDTPNDLDEFVGHP